VTSELEHRWHELMLASQGGDANSYRALLNELRVRLVAFYARRLGNAATGEDLVQDTLMAIHSRRETYDPNQPVTAWLFAIARYKLIDHFRRQKLRATLPLEEDAAIFATDETADIAARIDVETVLGAVPAKQRALIRKVRIEGASIAEAAAAQGMTETAAKVSIHRGMKALTARFTGERDGDR
jgi:RNA polymerase sigma factor (sigma-70 family)